MKLPSHTLPYSCAAVLAADRHCSGCDRPAFDCGLLTPCEVTFKTGSTTVAEFCGECLGIAEDTPGWIQQCTDMATIERIGAGPSLRVQPVRDAAIIGVIRAFEGRVLAEHYGGYAS